VGVRVGVDEAVADRDAVDDWLRERVAVGVEVPVAEEPNEAVGDSVDVAVTDSEALLDALADPDTERVVVGVMEDDRVAVPVGDAVAVIELEAELELNSAASAAISAGASSRL
jgi:hypothetical protein